jgi:hypothetical protein
MPPSGKEDASLIRGDKEEITRYEALREILTDEDLCDLSLKGADGKEIRACRSLLGARSSVFRTMLFGDFAEANSSTVALGYDSAVLEAIVKYIHSDDAKILSTPPKEYTQSDSRILVELAGAALYFNLPRLSKKARGALSKAMDQQPCMAFEILSACREAGPSAPEDLASLALSRIQFLNIAFYEECRMEDISAAVLEEILSDEESQLNELDLFLILKLWANGGATDPHNNANHPKKRSADSLDRHSVASELTKHISFERIGPSDLEDVVAESGLVTQEQLFEAFKKQALTAQKKHNISFTDPRLMGEAVWKSSGTALFVSDGPHYVVETLKCRVLLPGTIHQWTIQVEESCEGFWVGVASTKCTLDRTDWLGKQQGGWVYGNNGAARHVPKCSSYGIHPAFRKNSKVSLTLDLRPDGPGNGRLSASIDGGSIFELFSNMLLESDGFLPAISLRRPGAARLLSFKKTL